MTPIFVLRTAEAIRRVRMPSLGLAACIGTLVVAGCAGTNMTSDASADANSAHSDGGDVRTNPNDAAADAVTPDATPPGDGGNSGSFPWNGMSFPWPIFDGTIPNVPPAAAPGHTWYCDPVQGNDQWDGTSFAFVSGTHGPKQTLNGALTIGALAAGDTILLGGGIYREQPNLGGVTGTQGAPITIGSYGHGTGAPIIDGGLKPNTWTHTNLAGQTTVWQTSTAGLSHGTAAILPTQAGDPSSPVLGIYVNSGTSESALREVVHGQLDDYGDGLPPNQTQADITDNSNHWYYDAGAQILYADFGGSLGTGDPNQADISILYRSHDFGSCGAQTLMYIGQGSDYFHFVGLTFRAASWDGAYIEAIGETFDHCDMKFNGGAGIAFGAGDSNVVTQSRIWMNVLDNWPRFNNGNSGGGWPGALSWYSQSNALAQGNVIYNNGGEALVIWGTDPVGHVSMNNVARNNVAFDNFSGTLYMDNTQNALVEQNFVFQHPRDASQTFDNLLTVSNGYNTDWGRRMEPPSLGLGDEGGSAADGEAHESNITVINNIFAGGNRGFLDSDDGSTTVMMHGLIHCVIANNTWVLGETPLPGQTPSYAWQHLFEGENPDPSTGSIFQNNILVTSTTDDRFVVITVATDGSGINDDFNLYAGPGEWTTIDMDQPFAAWKSAHGTWDQHSVVADAMLTNATEFSDTVTARPVYDWSAAAPQSGSPARGAGTAVSVVTTDFTGATRPSGSWDLGALTAQ